jgi:hypothetical protein
MRRKNDFYPTQSSMTRALLKRVSICGDVCEPAAGEMDMAKVLRNMPQTRVVTNDIVPYPGLDLLGDATDRKAAVWRRYYHWVVCNPPFSVAFPIVRLAWEHSTAGIAMLLRLSFLEPVGGKLDKNGRFYWDNAEDEARGKWLKEREKDMSHLLIFGSPRPSFTVKGTDWVTTCWCVWQHGYGQSGMGTKVRFLPGWKEVVA